MQKKHAQKLIMRSKDVTKNTTTKTQVTYGNSHLAKNILVEFTYLVFTHVPGESYCGPTVVLQKSPMKKPIILTL